MQKLKFQKLMDAEPFEYCEFTNVKGQKVRLVEHPYQGDEYPVIVIFPDFEAAFCSDFWDIEDMTAEDSEYQPIYDEQTKKCLCLYEMPL